MAIERGFALTGRKIGCQQCRNTFTRSAATRPYVSDFDMLKAIAVRPFLDFRFGAPKLKRRLHDYSPLIEHRRHQADCASRYLRPLWDMEAEVTPAYSRRLYGSTRKPISVACPPLNSSPSCRALTHRRPTSFSGRFKHRIFGKL